MITKSIGCSQLTIMMSACIPLSLIRLLEKAAIAVARQMYLVVDSQELLTARKQTARVGIAATGTIAWESTARGGISIWEEVIFARVGGLFEGGARPRYGDGSVGPFASWCLSGQRELVEMHTADFIAGVGQRLVRESVADGRAESKNA
jgi:hypothetical protein